MYKVLLKASAEKALYKLPEKTRTKVAQALDDIARLGIHAPHTKKLQKPIGGYRTRVGDYRILFDSDDELVLVHHISKRADAYKNK